MKQDDKIRYLEDNKGENTQSEPKTKQINKGIYELYPYKMGNVHFKHFTCLGWWGKENQTERVINMHSL